MDDLRVDDPQILVESRVHDHVVSVLVHRLTNLPQSVHSMDVNQLEEFHDALVGDFQLLNQSPHELNKVWVPVDDAKIEAEKQGKLVFLDVIGVLRNNGHNVQIELG